MDCFGLLRIASEPSLGHCGHTVILSEAKNLSSSPEAPQILETAESQMPGAPHPNGIALSVLA